MAREDGASSSSDDGAEAARKPRKKSKFADSEDMLVTDFLAAIDKPPEPPTEAAPPPPPKSNLPAKPPPPLYFDVKRSSDASDDDLLGRLDLSGSAQLTFGRDPQRVDVGLDHASISRHHATMTFDAGQAYIADISSTHGTFIKSKGEPLERKLAAKEMAQLQPGDVVRFGESSRVYVFGVAVRAAPAPVQPKPLAGAPGVTDLGGGAVRISLTVSAASIGRLTGKGGLTLRQIEQRTGAKLACVVQENKAGEKVSASCTVEGQVNAVAAARLELLAITQVIAAAATFSPTSAHGTQRFRYSSTIVHGHGDDDDLHESGTAQRRVW
ncbi:SMAD/FHA domain-containing protein [Pelagophyceae sp. CCMP2097]|nr:SMAD/FHA domain-containing protein [Pelagophyceae sp. CCMP2097]